MGVGRLPGGVNNLWNTKIKGKTQLVNRRAERKISQNKFWCWLSLRGTWKPDLDRWEYMCKDKSGSPCESWSTVSRAAGAQQLLLSSPMTRPCPVRGAEGASRGPGAARHHASSQAACTPTSQGKSD